MRTQYRLRTAFRYIAIVALLLSLVVSIYYIKNSTIVIWGILDNIMICVLTGCIIGYLQSIIGYASEKHTSIAYFYKEAIILEDIIINYPFMRLGFIRSDEGLKDVRMITHQYLNGFKFAVQCVFFDSKPDKILTSVLELSQLYESQIKIFRQMEDLLSEAIRFSDLSDAELLSEGIDITKATESMNKRLQAMEHVIERVYNDKKEQEKRTQCYEVIEMYLFSKTH